MKKYKIKWTVIESATYEVEAESFDKAIEFLLNECDMPDEITEQTFTRED